MNPVPMPMPMLDEPPRRRIMFALRDIPISDSASADDLGIQFIFASKSRVARGTTVTVCGVASDRKRDGAPVFRLDVQVCFEDESRVLPLNREFAVCSADIGRPTRLAVAVATVDGPAGQLRTRVTVMLGRHKFMWCDDATEHVVATGRTRGVIIDRTGVVQQMCETAALRLHN
jgi:hypothetical protein